MKIYLISLLIGALIWAVISLVKCLRRMELELPTIETAKDWE